MADTTVEGSAAQLGKERDRALVRAAGATLVARLVGVAASALTLATAARALGHSELGVVAVLTGLAVYLGFGDFGLGSLLMTRLPIAHAKSDHAEMRATVTDTLGTLTAIGFGIAAIGVASLWFVSWPALLGASSLGTREVDLAVTAFFICGAISIPAAVGSRVLAAMQRSSVVQLWSGAGSLGALVLTITCAKTDAPAWCFVAAVAGMPAVIGVVQSWWVLTRVFAYLRPRGIVVRPSAAWALVRSGGLFAVINLSALIAFSIDSLVVSSVLGAAAAAVFALAARMFTLVGGTLSLAGQQMWSALADAIARGDSHWARSRFIRSLVISGTVNGIACLILVVIGRGVSRIWFGPSLVPPLSLLIVFAIWTVYSAMMVQATYLMTAVERVRMIAFTGIVMAGANLAISIWLTHRYGLAGPILGSIIAEVLILNVPVAVVSVRLFRQLTVYSEIRPPYVGRRRAPSLRRIRADRRRRARSWR